MREEADPEVVKSTWPKTCLGGLCSVGSMCLVEECGGCGRGLVHVRVCVYMTVHLPVCFCLKAESMASAESQSPSLTAHSVAGGAGKTNHALSASSSRFILEILLLNPKPWQWGAR